MIGDKNDDLRPRIDWATLIPSRLKEGFLTATSPATPHPRASLHYSVGQDGNLLPRHLERRIFEALEKSDGALRLADQLLTKSILEQQENVAEKSAHELPSFPPVSRVFSRIVPYS
jgi:hypothetical protein